MRLFYNTISTIYHAQAEGYMKSLEGKIVKRRLDYLTNRVDLNEMSSGEKKLMKIKNTLDSFGLNRSKTQKQFHKAFLQATSQHIFKDDHKANMRRILTREGWDNMKQQILCLSPRRFGKTYAVGMFIVAYMMSIPYSEQVIFSTGRRASQKLLELIHKFIVKLDGKDHIIKYNAEVLWWRCDPNNQLDIRKVSSYPSASKTLRGVGGDVVYMEEAAFMDLSVFYEVIVPLLEVDSTALICISTPVDDLNFYSTMFEMKDATGENMFNTIKVALICDKCQKSKNPEKCTHNFDVIPEWKSKAKLDMVKALYGDNVELLKRESMGCITQDSMSVFKQNYVDAFFDRKPYALDAPIKYVFMTMDPTGGGDGSDCSLVTTCFDNHQYIIISMDTHVCKNHNELDQMLKANVRAIRKIDRLRTSYIIFIAENNLGLEASHAEAMIRDFRRVYSLREKKDGPVGVRTTHNRKELYTNVALDLFYGDALHFASCFFNTDSFQRGVNIKEKFKKQLLSFRKTIVKTQNAKDYGEGIKHFYSGKASGQDDMVLSFIIGCYWAKEFIARRTIAPYHMFR